MIWSLLTENGVAAPGDPDRATLRRFRRVVADLGTDLYLAEADGNPLGVLHLTYVRRLAGAPEARLELLVVAPGAEAGTAGALAAFAAARARRRGCAALRWAAAPAAGETGAVLEHLGWRRSGDALEFDLVGRAQ